MNAVDHATAASALLGVRVLLVDDIAEERNMLGNHLHRLGCRVFMAANGRDALVKALVVKPDILLMDILMPVCDGLTACRLLKQDPATRNVPVIFITNAALPEQRVAGLRAGAIDYVTKPFNFEEIQLRLAIHLPERPGDSPQAAEASPSARPLDHMLFMLARQAVMRDLATPVEPVQLAKALNCNPRRLNDAFRRCVGVTMLEYQREQRMKEACRLLTETALEVQEIAHSLGFTSGANFATAFRDRFSVSPTDYRRWRGDSNGDREKESLRQMPA